MIIKIGDVIMSKPLFASLAIGFASFFSYAQELPEKTEAAESSIKNEETTPAVVSKDTSLLLWYKFDETTGTAVKDSSGNGHDAELNQWVDWVKGKKGNALDFEGAILDVPNAESLFAKLENQITISFWTFDDGSGTQHMQTVWYGKNSDDKDTFACFLPENYHGEKLQFRVGDAWHRTEDIDKTKLQNKWIHWLVVKNVEESKTAVYRDGVEIISSYEDSGVINNIKEFTIGGIMGGHYKFPGYIDDFRIYKKALTLTEIKALATGE